MTAMRKDVGPNACFVFHDFTDRVPCSGEISVENRRTFYQPANFLTGACLDLTDLTGYCLQVKRWWLENAFAVVFPTEFPVAVGPLWEPGQHCTILQIKNNPAVLKSKGSFLWNLRPRFPWNIDDVVFQNYTLSKPQAPFHHFHFLQFSKNKAKWSKYDLVSNAGSYLNNFLCNSIYYMFC